MKRMRRQRGVASVELGFLIIPLLLLTFGTTEFGRAIYQYNTLAKASRDATRFLSGQAPGDAGDTATAQCLVVYGDATCTNTTPLLPGLTTSMVTVCDSVSCPSTHQSQTTGSGAINLVTVTISGYQFTSLVPFIASNMTFNDIHTTMRQIL
ncbi:TadE/TadG family type IV pilus assembly protein [Rugamonas apoptosis]|uniref:Pilus assembly protein n=1 Tax=Rugamonas apoptosis TaxID=2758570 RepID=A0A7W2IJF7_9BURK|nr:TadE/TadG family type IV pilus assembly protein [Rugamonas apoptosis]MBA5686221.1 pilus assembly protein [Rugamonas apoptosis]